MGIFHLEQAKILKQHGSRIGRLGMSQRVLIRVREFNDDPSYKNAMKLAGQLKAVAQAARCDHYWDEKTCSGFQDEYYDIQNYTPDKNKLEPMINSQGVKHNAD